MAEIQVLRDVGEFKTFTIAFYGETNAGKSTIIESLRLYFNEATKQEQRVKFYENHQILEKMQGNIARLENELKILEKKYASTSSKTGFMGWVQKIKDFLPFSLSRKIKHTSKKINSTKTKYSQIIKEKLLEFSDGVIIGDGRSDFTQKSHIYHFEFEDKTFDIIDVPGIEGKEEKVIDEILKAVKKAHCVLYITHSPQPPQKGDDKDSKAKGTVEKIKEHLGSQTEVYSIYNKAITSPIQLEDSISSKDDELGLSELDLRMEEVLSSKHYMGRKTLSAQIAFYALSNNMIEVEFIDDNDLKKAKNLAKGRKKFLEKYSQNDLLEKSLFLDFVAFIKDDLVSNVMEKIKKSCFSKSHDILNKMSSMLKELYEIYDDLYKECKKEVDESCDNIDRILNGVERGFKSKCDSIIGDFNSKVRKQMYDKIDEDISNTEFKEEFERVIKEKQEALDFENASKQSQKEFQEELKDELENLQRRIGNVAEEFREISLHNQFDSSIDIKIDSGINKMGLLGVGVGAGGLAWAIIAGTNIWNPLGITMIALSAIGLIISFAKAVGGFFSKNYKKAQQRKEVDKNLKKISQDMQGKVEESICKYIKDEIKPHINKLQDELKQNIENIKRLSEFLEDSQSEVKILANEIKIEGGL